MPPQLGPATMGFMQYDVLDASSGSTLGRVVVTGTAPTGLSQPARTAVWSWTDSGRTAFPTDFRLVYDSGGDGSLPWSNKWAFLDGPFDNPGSAPASPGTYSVHRVKDHNGAVVGYLWNKVTTKRLQHWSGVPAYIDAAGMYADRDQGLWFSDLSPPTPSPTWRWRNDTP